MAKNTMMNTDYRKLDVDAYDPERYQDQEDADTPGFGPDEQQAERFILTNQLTDALHVALQNPPLKTKNQSVKDKATALMVRILTSFKQSEMEKAIENLNREEMDLLMKYIYKGMEKHADGQACQSLLLWHANVFNKAGLGSIVRAMTDRRHL